MINICYKKYVAWKRQVLQILVIFGYPWLRFVGVFIFKSKLKNANQNSIDANLQVLWNDFRGIVCRSSSSSYFLYPKCWNTVSFIHNILSLQIPSLNISRCFFSSQILFKDSQWPCGSCDSSGLLFQVLSDSLREVLTWQCRAFSHWVSRNSKPMNWFWDVILCCFRLTLAVQDTQTMHLKLGLFLRFLASKM